MQRRKLDDNSKVTDTPKKQKTTDQPITPTQQESDDEPPFEKIDLTNNPAPFETINFTNNPALFETINLTNGPAPFEKINLTNGPTPFETRNITNGPAPFETIDLTKSPDSSHSNDIGQQGSLLPHGCKPVAKAMRGRGRPRHVWWKINQNQQNNLERREEKSTENSYVDHNQGGMIRSNVNLEDTVVIHLSSHDDKKLSSDPRSEGNTPSPKQKESLKAPDDSEIKSLLSRYGILREGAFSSHDPNKEASDGNQSENQQKNLDRINRINFLG